MGPVRFTVAGAPGRSPAKAARCAPAQLTGLLAVQRQAGNRAVARLIAQRCGDVPPDQCACHSDELEEKKVQRLTTEDKTDGLTSSKYHGQPRLEAAFDNAPVLGIGESGEGVRLVQEGLAAEGHALPKSTTPDGGLDGKFGGETLGVVRDFQSAKSLPGGPDGRVGHKTMGKLDELADGGGGKAKKGPADVCSDPPCGEPYVEIKPGMFVSLCSSKLKTGTQPAIRTVGCTPGRQGNIGFFTGQPAWQLDGAVNICGPLDKSIEIGYVQTVAAAVDMSVYRDPRTGILTTGQRECVTGARDCLNNAPAPWFDAPGNNFGPQKLGVASPILVDTPNMPQLKSREPGKGNLQSIFFQGLFNVWLIARLPGGKTVFIHHWDVILFARALLNAGADPCNITQWAVDGGANEAGNAPGAGSASPVLTGSCARTLAKPC
jgi:peptidoglycan hydrolase-like protein with peptidoglycan-binding domain